MICLLHISLSLLLFNSTSLCVLNIRGRYSTWKFCKQLECVPIYYLKDKDGNIVKNIYNTLDKGTSNSNAWSPSRFRNLNKSVEWDVTMDSIPASVIPLFVEEELAQTFAKNIGKGSYVVKGTLSDYLKWSETLSRDTCILFPDRQTLDLCTKNNSFTGTPIFITNPPIKVTVNGKFKGYAFFISHSHAIKILNRIMDKNTVDIDGKTLSLEYIPTISDRLKGFMGFSKINLKGFNPKHFTLVNSKIYATSIELLHALIYNHPELGDNIIIINK